MLAISVDGTLHCISEKMQKQIWMNNDFQGNRVFLSLGIDPMDRLATVGLKSGDLLSFDLNKQSVAHEYEKGSSFSLGHVNRVTSVKYVSPNMFISAGNDRMVYFWDVRMKHVSLGVTFSQRITFTGLMWWGMGWITRTIKCWWG